MIGLGATWYSYVLQTTADITRDDTVHNTGDIIAEGEPRDPAERLRQPAQDPSSSQLSAPHKSPNISEAQALIDQGLTTDGIAALQEILKQDPSNTQAMMELALAYILDRKDSAAARPVLEHILDINPNHRAALNELELVYRELGSTQDGIDFLKLKSQQNPQSLELQYACGRLLADKNPGEALPWLQNALAISDLREDVLDHLGSAAFRVGQTERARAAWQEALALAQQNLEKARAHDGTGVDFLEDRVASAQSQLSKVSKL